MEHLIKKITNEDTYHLLNIQTVLMNSIYRFFNSKNVHYILPVILSPETDKLQDDVLDCSIEYYDQKLNLMKSMILQKQLMLLNKNIENIYTVSPCVRLEKREKFIKGRHSIEFQQLDMEFKNKDSEYVIDFIEELIVYLFSQVIEKCADDLQYFNRTITVPTRPFKRYDNKKCLSDIGENYEEVLSKNNDNLFWVFNFDRWIYDKKVGVDGESKNINYDIILPDGFCELGSGGEREIEKNKIIEKMKELEISIDEHESYLNALQYDFVPSAGIGLGIQRFLRFFTGQQDIDKVIPFSRSVEDRILL